MGLAVKGQKQVREIDVGELQAELKKNGAFIGI
jgi:hypothetical protein